jgi:ABC-type phosphate/phosphonate transport system permease subunit
MSATHQAAWGMVMKQLTVKQVKNLRRTVKYYRWSKWLAWFVPVFLTWSAGMQMYFAWRICRTWGYTFKEVFDVFNHSHMQQMHQGALVIAAGHVAQALYMSGLVVIGLLMAWAAQGAHRKNQLLLHYIDQQ